MFFKLGRRKILRSIGLCFVSLAAKVNRVMQEALRSKNYNFSNLASLNYCVSHERSSQKVAMMDKVMLAVLP